MIGKACHIFKVRREEGHHHFELLLLKEALPGIVFLGELPIFLPLVGEGTPVVLATFRTLEHPPRFDGRAAEGTTPATRLFGRSFPDLFATVLSHIDALPRPRQRGRASVLSG